MTTKEFEVLKALEGAEARQNRNGHGAPVLGEVLSHLPEGSRPATIASTLGRLAADERKLVKRFPDGTFLRTARGRTATER